MNTIHIMNDYHSRNELEYKHRWITDVLHIATENHPVVVITGARQVGKSTLLLNEKSFKDWDYKSLDDFDILEQAGREPQALWAGEKRIIIDEVQKATNLLSSIKIAVDTYCRDCRFVLSGSANLLLMKKVSESLAGRAVYFNLLPLTLGEMYNREPSNLLKDLFSAKNINDCMISLKNKKINTYTTKDLIYLMWKGSMPALLKFKTETPVIEWWEGYVLTYLERDLRQLSQIDSLSDFRRLLGALALRCGTVINQTEISRDTGVPQPTIHRYLNLLETSFIIERIPAFYVNRTKRLIKSPKLLFVDPGLVSYLSGYFEPQSLTESKGAGGIFETFVYLHLKALAGLITPRPALFYWKTTTGKEVDFVITMGKEIIPVEVKLADKPKYADIQNLNLFIREYPETKLGVLIYAGDEIKIMHEKIIALPWYFL